MPEIDIICLASSRKHQGSCVAGLRTDGAGWARPVADTADGTLFTHHYQLGNGSEPMLLDRICIRVGKARPGPHHPEDWVIEKASWNLVERPARNADALIRAHLMLGPTLLGCLGDRILAASVQKNGTRKLIGDRRTAKSVVANPKKLQRKAADARAFSTRSATIRFERFRSGLGSSIGKATRGDASTRCHSNRYQSPGILNGQLDRIVTESWRLFQTRRRCDCYAVSLLPALMGGYRVELPSQFNVGFLATKKSQMLPSDNRQLKTANFSIL